MKYEPTNEQKIALTADRNSSLTANAGSGKTTVLVNRYLDLLLYGDQGKGINPENIVAITFSNEAANEMLNRVFEKIDRLIDNCNDFKLLKQLKYKRESLNNARISTIHSFCTELLKEYPIEAGLNPLFENAKTSEIARLKNDIIYIATCEWLIDIQRKEKMEELLLHFNQDNLFSIIGSAIESRKKLDDLNELFDSGQINKNYENAEKNIKDEFIKMTKTIVEYSYNAKQGINQYFAVLLSKTKNQKKKIEILRKESQLNVFYDKIYELFSLINSLEFEGVIDYFDSLKELVYSAIRIGRIGVFKFICKENEMENDEIDDFRKKYRNILDYTDNIKNDEIQLKISKILLEFSNYVMEQFIKEKQEKNVIDYDDMIYLAVYKLLDNEEIVETTKKNIKYLLVDEFQDTNFTQYELIRKLCPNLQKGEKDDTNLFIVGDAKQSIYGFRNADVRVFLNAIEDINKQNQKLNINDEIDENLRLSNGKTIKVEGDSIYGKNQLTTTFRLSLNLGIFVNYIFKNIMSSENSEYESDYQNLVVAKKSENYEKLISNKENYNLDDYGKISFLVTNDEIAKDENIIDVSNDEKSSFDDNDDNDESTKEATAVAKFIFNETKNTENNFSDYAILYRKRNGINILKEVLNEYNIPYRIIGDKSFYKAREVKDIILYFLFLVDENNDIAFAALLKSYFFGLTDNDLLNISMYKGNNFYERTLKYLEENPLDEHTKYAIEKIHHIKNKCYSWSFPNLVRKMIKHSKWHVLKTLSNNVEQLNANVYKLIDITREYYNKKFIDLNEFSEELEYLMTNEEEAEGSYNSDKEQISLLTIHASKGLEFKNVIIYGISGYFRNTQSIYSNEKYGFLFPVKNYNDEGTYIGNLNTVINYASKKEIETKELAELKRLLYVALTRAKENLILSITYKLNDKREVKKHSNKKMLNLIEEGVDLTLNNIIEGTLDKFSINDKIDYFLDGQTKELEHEISINIVYGNEIEIKEEDEEEIIKNEEQVELTYNELLDSPESEVQYEDFSATKLSIFDNSKSDYLDRYIYGVPTDRANKFYIESSKNEEIGGIEVGVYLHYCFENIEKWIDNHGNLIEEKLNEILDFKLSSSSNYLENESIKDRVLSDISNVLESDFYNSNKQQIINAEKEFQLKIPSKNDFFVGTLDLLVETENGFEVWDWKTNALNSKKDMKQVANHYQMQMKFYVYLLSLIKPNQKLYNAKLLFTNLAGNQSDSNDWVYEYSWTKEDVNNFKNNFDDLVKDIKESMF